MWRDTHIDRATVYGVRASRFNGQNRRWLVVFDGADTIQADEDDSYVDIEHYLPIDPSVYIIITTRSATAREMTSLKAVEVAKME